MEEKSVPFVVYEAAQSRNERTARRLVTALVIAIALMFVTNAIWLYAWMQYDYSGEETEILVDGKEGIANYIGNSGVIENGSDSGDNTEEEAD